MKVNTTSGWCNDGYNHVELVTWELSEHEDIMLDLKRIAKKHPTYRFSLRVWKENTLEATLIRMREQVK